MQVILKKDIERLGKFGEVVDVKDGYARNFLLPRGLAWVAEGKYLEKINHLKEKQQAQREREKEEAKELAAKIEKTSVTLKVETGEDEKLFGSVTSMDIQSGLKEAGVEVDKKDIMIDSPIKKLGVYKVEIKVHPEVQAKCKVWVVKAE